MQTVGVMINNSKYGLHPGHKTVIEFAKQFGEVHVELIENIRDRNKYLLTGIGNSPYKLNYSKVKKDCDDLNIKLDMPIYITYTDEERQYYYQTAQRIVEAQEIKNPTLFLSDRFKQLAICSLMVGPARKKYNRSYDVLVFGPDVVPYSIYRITKVSNSGDLKEFNKDIIQQIGNVLVKKPSDVPEWGASKRVELFDKIIKDKYGLKFSTSTNDLPFDKERLAFAIAGARKNYKIGRNDDLVLELNKIYSESVGWRWYEIIMYPRDGKTLELTTVSYRSKEGVLLVDNIDYY